MSPTNTNTLAQTPRGEGLDPLKINKNGVGESDVIFMGDRLYYITEDSYREIMRCRNRVTKSDSKFKIATTILLISNIATLGIANDEIYSRLVLTLAFIFIASAMILALKNTDPKNQQTKIERPDPKPTRQLSEKELHKKKTALAMLRQLEA